MFDSIISFLTTNSDEILKGVLITLLVGVVILWFKKIKHWSGLAWKKIMRSILAIRPKVYRALGVAPIEDVQVLDAKVHRIGTPTSSEKQPKMVFRDNVWWIGHTEDGPYCPKCYGANDKVLPMAERSDDRFWRCPVCDTAVERPGRGSRPVRAETEDEFSS